MRSEFSRSYTLKSPGFCFETPAVSLQFVHRDLGSVLHLGVLERTLLCLPVPWHRSQEILPFFDDMTLTAFIPVTPARSVLTRATTRAPLASRRARQARPAARTRPTMRVYDVEILLYGEKHIIPIDEELTLLEGIEEYGLEVLHSCRAGVCVTCAAKIIEGEVDLGVASLTDELKEKGYVLTCSGFPRSEGIKLEMNHFDSAYEQQYGQFEQDRQ